ncbi:MAG TPA: sigma 54-interacting transcriptional regulator [Polyangia bacterium]|jgi:DNA-binding NtrC family response regulator|nr:sigma 54-interacting transcriptional regulator [Polyangia bacterium]
MSKRRKEGDGAPSEELKIRTAPVDDDGRFGRMALIFPDGKRFSLEHATVIGSGEGVDVHLDDPCVSRRHCVIEPTEERVTVRDLASTNGTLLNGVRVPIAELRPGLVLTLGTTRLRVAMDTKVDAEIVGESAPMQRMRAEITRYAVVPMPVLVLGETGTGKELVARALHDQSGRRGAFVPVNCGSLPKDLIESEMFGHERGAFTGAETRRKGFFQEADGGTLFLDEIGELPETLQTRLLRVLESGVVRPVGSTREHFVNVRVVAATHVDLERAVAQGRFRSDLYYRLNAASIHTPSLRSRRSDIPLLVERILQDEAALGHRCRLSGESMGALMEHSWPGNVRELKNVLRRAAAVGSSVLQPEDLRIGDLALSVDDDVVTICGQTYVQIEKEILSRTVRRCDGNQRAASAELDMPRSTLNDKLRRYRIDAKEMLKSKRKKGDKDER